MTDQVDTNALYTAKKGQRLWVEGTGPEMKGETARWTLKLAEDMLWLPNRESGLPWELQLHGNIVAAVPFTTVEGKLKNQRDSIERLLIHLGIHCPKLLGTGECPHITSD